MEVKRFRMEGEEIEPAEPESVSVADALMLLSRGDNIGSGGDGASRETGTSSSELSQPSSPPVSRVFECKTCNRQFLSFQALGGHRASHMKPRLDGAGGASQQKPKAHECSICGLEFAIGQALGGHMRRHRVAGDRFGGYAVVEKKPHGRRVMCFDLNLLPSENNLDQIQTGDKPCMIEFSR